MFKMGKLVRRDNAIVGKKVRRSMNWMYGNQDLKEGVPCTGRITKLQNMSGSKNWVEVKWDNGHRNVYEVEPERFSQLVYVPNFKPVYVSDIDAEDAEVKRVKKYLVKEDENDDFSFVCVNKEEEAEKYEEDPDSVKTSSWMFAVDA